MTAVQTEAPGTPVGAEPVKAEPVAAPPRVQVPVVAGQAQIPVLLDGVAKISRMMPALVKLINDRLKAIGEPPLVPGKRGRWALCWVDGTALRPDRSLSEHGYADGVPLWLTFIADTEARVPVIEHVTSAIPEVLAQRWRGTDPVWAARSGSALLSAALAVVLTLLLRWRFSHPGLVVPAAAGLLAVMLLVGAAVIGLRHSAVRRPVADSLMLGGCAAAALATAAAISGGLGAAHAAMATAVLIGAALLVVRFTGRFVGTATMVLVVGAATVIIGLARMAWVTQASVIYPCLLAASVFVMHATPAMSRWGSRLKLPSVALNQDWETRADLPLNVVVASTDDPVVSGPELDGPESVSQSRIAALQARQIVSGLLGGSCLLVLISAIGVCNPHSTQRWLTLTLAGLAVIAVALRSRDYDDRQQSTLLAVTAGVAIIGIAVRYALVLWSVPALLAACAVIVAVPAFGLVAAVIIPTKEFSEVTKILVEGLEYAALVFLFGAATWLTGVLEIIRYRMW